MKKDELHSIATKDVLEEDLDGERASNGRGPSVERSIDELRASHARQDRKDAVPAAILSVVVHAALVASLFMAVQWNTADEAVYAELWAPEDVSGGADPEGVAQRSPEPQAPDAPEKSDESQAAEEARAQAQAAAAAQEAQARAEAERIEAERVAEEARKAQEAARAENERLAQERARAEEIQRQQEAAIEAERLKEVERQRLEEERIAQERLAEERRLAEEARKAEEAARAEEERAAEEERRLEAERKAEEERIAREKAEEAARAAAAKAEAERAAAELKAREEKRIAEEKRIRAEKARKAAQEKAERARIAKAMREQELARLTAQIDPNSNRSGVTTGDPKNFKRSLRGSAKASYMARVAACVRQYIVFEVPASVVKGQYQASYSIQLLPTGEQIAGSLRQLKASGLPAYDSAVERAIRSCNPFPRPDPGYETPRELQLDFDPVDDRE